MIFVKRDLTLIPQKVLKVAERAQKKLETLNTPTERREFIKKKSHIWRAFGKYLARMSYGKCWYSESPDPQSFFDVDHFRPKLEARRSDTEIDKPGYEWLAFSWDNFRYAANCANRESRNDETGVVEGKNSWFPLLVNSVKANWANRCELQEKPLLIDPCRKEEVKLVDVHDDGRIIPSKIAIGTKKIRVAQSGKYYGLNLPRIKEARQQIMRDVQDLIKILDDTVVAANAGPSATPVLDLLPIENQLEVILQKACPRRPYSLAARAVIARSQWACFLVDCC